MKSKVSGELTLEVGTEDVIREEGRKYFIGTGNIWMWRTAVRKLSSFLRKETHFLCLTNGNTHFPTEILITFSYFIAALLVVIFGLLLLYVCIRLLTKFRSKVKYGVRILREKQISP